ncbi:histidine phosphotransferase ChpT [Rubricella aquisinus]|uniref:Histidine phosphotransferase ChpT n=1 Tax=Rubricella aquisinus TaxID=2028108 RepID=A0A840X6W0_9RHOB|nr:histidine phosphotransferase family protein [Rubricella aquisinus]MBB5516437.1 histidine phosphotransferase ChpT [Rubricella aquisinus]
METPPCLTELITSRLCHDLISPVGAIGNGVELLRALGPAAGGEDLDLIADSADMAQARIGLFRRAFGQPMDGGGMAHQGLQATLITAFTKPRLQADITPLPEDLSGLASRALCLAALCIDRALPRGGVLTIRAGHRIEVLGTGDKVSLTERQRALLSNAHLPPEEARELEFHFLAKMSGQLEIDWRASDSEVRVLINPAP